jgi:hypothetical protein
MRWTQYLLSFLEGGHGFFVEAEVEGRDAELLVRERQLVDVAVRRAGRGTEPE